MRFFLAAALSLTCVGAATAATTDPYPVIPLAQPAPPAATVNDGTYWLSAGVGVAHASTYNALAFNAGLYGSLDRFVYGVRANVNRGDPTWYNGHDIRQGREQALMLGHYLDRRNMTWAGIGISRIDAVGGRHPDDQRVVGVGLPLEFVFSPPGRHVAPEIRFNVDLNRMNSFMMLTFGLRVGQLK